MYDLFIDFYYMTNIRKYLTCKVSSFWKVSFQNLNQSFFTPTEKGEEKQKTKEEDTLSMEIVLGY